MGKCKDCAEWSQDASKSSELDSVFIDQGIERTPLERGYGRCDAAKEGAPAMPKYDGGYTGELLTHAEFGCNQFRSK